MPDAFSLAGKCIGVTNISPANLSSDAQLLRIHLQVSCRRYAILVGASIALTPVVYAISRRLTLTNQTAIREFLDAEDGKTNSSEIRVVYEHAKVCDEPGRKAQVRARWEHPLGRQCLLVFSHVISQVSPYRLLSSGKALAQRGRNIFQSCGRIICRCAAFLGGGGWEGAHKFHDFPSRVVSYTLNYCIRYATTRWIVSCLAQLSFFCICVLLDHAIKSLASSQAFVSVIPLQGGWGNSGSSATSFNLSGREGDTRMRGYQRPVIHLAGMYQLGDFSYSAMGFITRSSGRWLRTVVMGVKVVFAPHTNFFWMQPQCADEIWRQLTPAGFVLSTLLAVLPSVLHAFWSGIIRTVLLLHKRSKVADSHGSPFSAREGLSLPTFHGVKGTWQVTSEMSITTRSGKSGGTITLGKVATKRQIWKNARRYLINYHFLGAPLSAFIGASYSWKNQHIAFCQHTAGGAYESVSIALFLWSLITLFISTPDIPTSAVLD